MSPVSDQRVWLTRDLTEHIRSVLDPLVEYYSAQASEIGSDPGRQQERSHHVGRAQGLIDAIRALGPPAPVVSEPGLVTGDVVRRMRTNSARHRSGT